MQEKLTIARPYAAAAFSYAVEHGEVGRRDAGAEDLFRTEFDRAQFHRGYGLLQRRERQAKVQQGANPHVAGDAGEAV